MTTKHKRPHHASGNAMVYVLIALALFGFLTVTLSSQNDQADGQNLSDEQAELYANELISYAASAQQVVDMMIATGSEIDDLDFINPASAGFDTPPHHHKVFHPAGGGLNYQENLNNNIGGLDSVSLIKRWYYLTTNNVEWTPTIANDVIVTAYNIKKNICEHINEQITGGITIPSLNESLADTFTNGAENLNVANCGDCEGYTTLCVENSAGTAYGFYTIIAAQ